MNNFFDNYLNGNSLENNLLYIITMMLKEEIDNLKDIPQYNNFLDNSKASLFLEKMINFPDVQLYFKKIIFHMVESMENNYSWKKMNFSFSKIYHNIKKFMEEENKKFSKKNKKTAEEICYKYIKMKLNEQCINTFDNDEYSDEYKKKRLDLDASFTENITNITKNELEELIKISENSKNFDFRNYYLYLYNTMEKKSAQLYSNVILEKFTSDKEININNILYLYQYDFINVTSLIDTFIEDLLYNLSLIPDSIKYICKVISLLIKSKYKDIPKHTENAFISKFFINKLLLPILKSPNFNGFINDFIISGYTMHNMEIVIHILVKIFSGNLFQINSILPDGIEETNLTLFNRYIMDTFGNVLNFYTNLVNISLPTFIENYINNSLPSDYTYDYFKENPEEIYAHISACFNLNNIIILINTIRKGEEEFFLSQNNKNIKLKRIYNKLKSKDKLDELAELDNKVKRENNKSSKNINNKDIIINYYLLNEGEIEQNYESVFAINNKISGFYIDIKKLEKNRLLEEKEKNLFKFKNYLINSLKNYESLKLSSFKSTENIQSILSQMKNITANSYLNKYNISSNWNICSVLDYMKKIPEEYMENDFKKCFEELTQELNQSIAEFDFEKLIMLKKNVEPLDKIYEFYLNKKKLIKDLNANLIIKKYIEETFFPTELKFIYGEEEKQFEIKKKANMKEKPFKDNCILDNIKDGKIKLRTISSFIHYFPDLNIYQDIIGTTPFEIIKELEINKKLIDYFDVIKSSFTQENNCTAEKYDKIFDLKFKNYIMNKLYKKIYPKDLEYEDSKLFEKTMHLSWVEPKMIIKGDNNLDTLDNLLPDILQVFKNLNTTNSPYGKFFCIKKIFELIGMIVKINDDAEGGNKDIGAEDITPYLNFVLIRACPVKLFTDIKYIKFFLKEEGNMEYDLISVEAMCKKILESSYKDFNLSQSEYIQNCNNTLYNSKKSEEKRFKEIMDRFERAGSIAQF